jgi:uncharacterized membrane-anchored protein YhcB (DUF1043 family)
MSQEAVSILVAVITGGLSLVGVILTVRQSAKKQDANMRVSLALMKKDIENLTQEVRKHNGFAERLPKLEQKVEDLASQLRD